MNMQKKNDVYAISMELEAEARKQEAGGNLNEALRLWRRYAKLKLEKGSYFLSSYGRYSEGRILEKKGRLPEGARKYSEAAEIIRSKCEDLGLVAFLLLESARCWENACRPADARRAYEQIARMWADIGDHFKAADAYERAATVIERTGRSLMRHQKPGKEWIKCYEEHLKKGDVGDALWSLMRAKLYFERIGARRLANEVVTLLEELKSRDRA